ncbi:MAG: hypothetical protein SGI72_09060 [Planctomycetota bacterium]|nr:hypothetical protein [Planctomycetota bacterium]
MRFPMFGFVLLAFLLLAVVLAVAVFFAFKSGEQGKTKLSGFAGCAIALALLVIAGIGAVGLLIVAAIAAPNEWARRGPVKSMELHWNEDSAAPAPDAPDHHMHKPAFKVRVELRGSQDTQDVMRWIRRETDERTTLSVHEERDSNGNVVTAIEITPRLEVQDRKELREIFDELKRDLPDLNLPAGGRVEFRGPND